ncbi:MAG: M20 family metallopeptidase [Ktedonobacteraceae bacterium]|nr:M20 family metallopeptidase [Ktedonobacteraceae bacterium]
MSSANIQQSELWEIASKLVSFNTVSQYTNLPAAEFLANYLDERGLTVQLLTQDVYDVSKATVVAWAGPPEQDGLIISGHTDIVPFDKQPGWKSDPLRMHQDGDRIFGRGVTDMKVFLAQAILAVKNLTLGSLRRPLVYIFTYDEEVAAQGSSRLVSLLPNLFRDYPLPKIALIGEPTDFDIYPAHKGYATFDVRIHGKGGHSSVPASGLNAIDTMADVIHVIQEVGKELQWNVSAENRQLFPEVPYSTFNSGMISGGLAPNMIADECRLTVSIRVAPGDDATKIIQTVRERVKSEIAGIVKAAAPEGGIFLEKIVSCPPMRSPSEGPFSDLLSRVTGKNLAGGVSFATDGGHFQTIGINSYVCGPGILAEAHQPNESIPAANFSSGQGYLEQIIHGWCVEEHA